MEPDEIKRLKTESIKLYRKNKEKSDVEEDEVKKIISFTKKKLSTKNLSELLSIIYKKPKKFFYTKLIKTIR